MSPLRQRRFSTDDEPHFVVRSAQGTVHAGQVIEAHAHDWPQLIYASRGVMTVWTEQGSWVAPPNWAILAPAGARHSIRFSGESRFDTLYLQPAWAQGLPIRCTVVTVSPLLRELILETVRRRMLDGRDAGDAALARMLRDCLRFDARSPFDLPKPTSGVASMAASRLQAKPTISTAGLVEELGVTLRTLERRFVAETGLSLGAWRRQAVMLKALQALAAGETVKVAASLAGYRGSSAFVAAFKAQFGETPGRYFTRS